MKGKEGINILTEQDIQYLTDFHRSILESETKRDKPNMRVFKILKRFASISKRVEGLTSYFKGFSMDTDAMSWVMKMYENSPPNTDEYRAIANVVKSYTAAQIWLGYFFSLVNSMNHNLSLRRLTSAEHILRKMELEVERSRRIFKEFNRNVKELRSVIIGSHEDVPDLTYFK